MESRTEGRRIQLKTDPILTAMQLEMAGLRRGARFLDLGCAAGTTSRIAADIVGSRGSVVGVDASSSRIVEARVDPGHRPWIEYRHGLAEAVPAGDGEFDVSWCRFLFEYLSRPQDVIRELVRVTRPGGTVFISDLDGNCCWHAPIDPELQSELEAALLECHRATGFDPSVGRRLYGLAYEAGLTNLSVDIRSYHVIAGAATTDMVNRWRSKLRTVSSFLRRQGWTELRARNLIERFEEFLSSPSTFTYSVLISVRGQKTF